MEQPKGIEVVKEGIRKLRFSQQLRKAEGQKTPKVELTVSVDGVAIQEAKGKVSISETLQILVTYLLVLMEEASVLVLIETRFRVRIHRIASITPFSSYPLFFLFFASSYFLFSCRRRDKKKNE